MATIKDFFVKAGAQTSNAGQFGVGSANYMQAAGAASGNPVTVTALGTDPNISINFIPKGTGTLLLNGAAFGVPGGSNTQIQYNNNGVFGGIATTGSGNVVLATSASLTTPSISGGTHTGVTSLGLRNAGTGAFDLTVAHNGTLTAARTLTFNVNDASRLVSLTGDVTMHGAFGLDITLTGGTTITFPQGGTLATVGNTLSLNNNYSADFGATDLNTFTFTQLVRGQTFTNAPNGDAGNWFIFVQGHDANNCVQIAIAEGNGGSAAAGDTYRRSLDTGTWGSWIRIIDSNLASLAGKLTTASTFTTVGANALTLTTTGATNVTLPTSGTLATTTSSISGSAGSVANAVTFNNGGAGAASGSTFNGSAAVTVSYNTVGAPSTGGTNATGTWGISISGTAATATNATNTAITDDTTTAATMFPTWVTANTGNLPQKTTSTKLTFNPSTGVLSSTSFTGAGTGLTGTASSLSIGGNAATATSATTANAVANAVTFNNSNTGAASGTTFNGGSAITVSANTIGAVPLSGGTMTGALTLNADPSQPMHAATKQYVDATTTGLDVKPSARLGTTAALTVTYANGTSGVGATLTNAGAQAAFALDGITLNVGERVLVKNQASAFQNGIYTVTNVGSISTNWILTRSTDADTAAEVTPGMFTFIEEGNTLSGTGWVLNSTGATTIGTTNLPFVQFSSAGVATPGNGLVQVGNVFNFASSSNYTVGSLFYANSTTTVGQLADAATGNVLLSGGSGATPSYGKVVIDTTQGTSHVTGTLQVGSGGTGTTTLSGIAFGNGTSAFTAATGSQIATAIGSTAVTNATNSANAAIADDTTTAATMFLTWVTANTGNLPVKTTSTKLTFNPSTGTLSSTTFSGSLSGNASTATSATSATNATNTAITDDTTTAATMYLTWVTANTGNLPQKTTSTKLTFNPSTGVLSSTSFTGAGTGLTGTASSLSIGGNAATATSATSATNATNTGITDDTTTNATMYLTWVTANTGNLPQKTTSTKLTFNPSTGVLTASGGFSGTATNATNVATTDDTATAATMFPLFASASSGNNGVKTSSTKLTYNPSTGTLSATSFNGTFSGTVTNAANIAITDDTTTNATMYPVWVTANTGNLPAKTTSSKLSFNPSTGTLNASAVSVGTGAVTAGQTTYGTTATMTTGSASVTTTSTTTVDTWSSTSYRSARYTIHIVDGTSYEVADMLIIHDGTTPYVTTFGNVFTSSNSLGAFDASISAGVLSVTYTAVSATTKTVKFTRQLLTV